MPALLAQCRHPMWGRIKRPAFSRQRKRSKRGNCGAEGLPGKKARVISSIARPSNAAERFYRP